MTYLLGFLLLTFGCQKNVFPPEPITPQALKDVPAVRLNYRYEADVPDPPVERADPSEQRNAAVQSDFDTNRNLDLLERTIPSPDKKHILAVYRNISDVIAEYRLDMYSPEGKLQKKVTSDTMAVHFPDTIVWSPDSNSVAFVAMVRAGQVNSLASPIPTLETAVTPLSSENANTNENVADVEKTATATAPTPPSPTGILTFRTEQIYICNAEGTGVKPITENEGLIYFYYTWSPDSSMLAALATTAREWNYFDFTASHRDPPEQMIPLGRPRIIEKNGRERRLDDNMTAVHPVWSPDSAKVATAFETQIRIYDAGGTNPTQAAIPLRNQLLISSQAYDREQQRQAQSSNSDTANSANTAQPEQPLSTLPDEKLLVSYNPIVELLWPENNMIYLKTAYIKRMKNEADNVTSFARWHRLPLSAQSSAPVK
jgi:hypothetical protein